jgi:hypothetical protein
MFVWIRGEGEDRERARREREKRKRLTLYSSHRKISTEKNVNLIYVSESPRKKYMLSRNIDHAFFISIIIIFF